MFFAPLFRFVLLSHYVPVLLATFIILHEEAHLPEVGGLNVGDAGAVELPLDPINHKSS